MSDSRTVKFAIKHSNGTFYRFMSAIGPCFGGTEDDAQKFDSKDEAAHLMLHSHWALSFDTEVVEVKP